MVPDAKLAALRLNYQAFKRRLPELLHEHEGQYALMRNGDVVEYFETARDALLAGRSRFRDDLFSVQEITRSEADFGWFSRVANRPDV